MFVLQFMFCGLCSACEDEVWRGMVLGAGVRRGVGMYVLSLRVAESCRGVTVLVARDKMIFGP